MRHGVKLLKFEFVFRTNVYVRALVTGRIAVVGSRKDGHTSVVMFRFVSFPFHLISMKQTATADKRLTFGLRDFG